MMVIKFKSSEEHSDLLHKVKKMKKFTDELEEMLEECYEEDDLEFRGGGSYRKEYDEDEMRHMEGRYGYRRGSRRM
jgi:hypothetical protein